jgi:hypothetical protein
MAAPVAPQTSPVITTQSTGKEYKGMKLACFICMILGLFGGFGSWSVYVVIISAFLFLAAIFGSWWDHG